MTSELLALGVIPARAHSSRFPLKVIHPLNGKPMLQHVWENARRARLLSELLVATDHPQIAEVVKDFGGAVMMTASELPSGTDRVAVVAKDRPEASIILNLQGDEPLLPPQAIDLLIRTLAEDEAFGMATLAVKREASRDFTDPNVVKAVFSSSGEAQNFTRQPVTTFSDGSFYKHIGIYAYRREALLTLCSLAPSPREKQERLEQWRALENGIRIKVAVIESDTVAVDTPEDVAKVEKHLSMRGRGVD